MAKEGKATCQRITADLCSLATALETGLLAGRGEKNARGETLPSVTASHELTRAEGHAGSRVRASPPPLPALPPSTTHPSSSPCSRQSRVGNRPSISLETKTSLWPRSSLSPPSAKSRTFFIVHSLCFLFSFLASDLDAEPPSPPHTPPHTHTPHPHHSPKKRLAKVCLLTKLSRQILVLVVLHCVHG